MHKETSLLRKVVHCDFGQVLLNRVSLKVLLVNGLLATLLIEEDVEPRALALPANAPPANAIPFVFIQKEGKTIEKSN